MRSKYDTYKEYHTSLDNLDFVSPNGLNKSFNIYKEIFDSIEADIIPIAKNLGEPMMSKRGLRPTTGMRGSANSGRDIMNFLMYSDGKNSLFEISDKIKISMDKAYIILRDLLKLNLIKVY